MIVKEKEPVILKCRISNPKAKAVWCKDGKPLGDRSRALVKQDGQLHTLTINNSQLSDIGQYSVSFDDDDCVLEANVDIKGKFLSSHFSSAFFNIKNKKVFCRILYPKHFKACTPSNKFFSRVLHYYRRRDQYYTSIGRHRCQVSGSSCDI